MAHSPSRTVPLAKGDPGLTNTSWAQQGGIAAVWDEADTVQRHTEDTVLAGADLSQPEVVSNILSGGKQAVQQLIDWGVKFDPGEGRDYDLTLEGGHTARRILHSADITGAEIQRALMERVRQLPNVRLVGGKVAVDLITERSVARASARKRFRITQENDVWYGPAGPEGWDRARENRCLGAYVLDEATGDVSACQADAVLLATGGAGKAFLYTSNPDSATGDGVALAWKAGATVAGMEFVQFHPTCVHSNKIKNFLVSEALRGEGGILRLPESGEAFMEHVHPLKNLAPRDIVAREIDKQIKKHGVQAVHLDLTHLDPEYVRARFPGIHQTLLQGGIDMTSEPIPVVPAAHYFCGGVKVDTEGRTGIHGLCAAGEVSSTGLHGANRLASNSLLEGCIYGIRAAKAMAEYRDSVKGRPRESVDPWDAGTAKHPDELVVIAHTWDEIRRLMWNYVGIVRTDRRLKRALSRLEFLRAEIQHYYWDYKLTRDLVELRNVVTVAELVVRSALARRESRGCSYNVDCPERDDENWQRRDVDLRQEWTKYY
eukprot:TRINITY_DN2610_c0_g1_i1.p1 TRINITY_DN2610_c0_g1~~TRINITY_DN2610_c0_g1_i1.p1  ORF type:complete len:578 (+),score=197.00 TRINITY_DN2610_c0_g1_i1:100-1734(+)